MRLVDREQRQLRLREQFQHAWHHQPFRRDVEQIELAAAQRAFHRVGCAAVERGVEECRAHAELRERRHLILHQRDQRRDHQRRALAQQRGQLVAQRFAAAGGHQHQRVAAVGDMRDDLLLRAAERRMAEDRVEQAQG